MSIPIKPSPSHLVSAHSSAIWPPTGVPAAAADSAMEQATGNMGQLVDSSKRFARSLFTVGENRLELLMVEVQEERERLLHAMLLMLGVAGFCFLALLALNVAIVVLLWDRSPVAVMLGLVGLYAVSSVWLYRRLTQRLNDWKVLSATLDQLRKDWACLKK